MKDEGGDRPYAPPSSSAAVDRHPELPRTSVLLMILFTLLTLGLYIPYWFLKRRRAFNHLAGEGDRVDLLTYAVAGTTASAWVLGLVSGVMEATSTPPGGLDLPLRLVDLGSRILTLILSFQIKSILEGNHPERLSALGTFFLSLFYLQYKINRLGETDPLEVEFTLR